MPDRNRVMFRRNGTIIITGSDQIIARWEKNPRGGWDVTPEADALKSQGANVSPLKMAKVMVMEWKKQMAKA